MLGFTSELHSIEEGLSTLHKWCLETHGKIPRKFILGPEEYSHFFREREFKGEDPRSYLDIPVVITNRSWLGIEEPKLENLEAE